MQVVGITDSTIKGGNALQTISIGTKENFLLGLTKAGQVYIWGEFSTPIPVDDELQGTQQKRQGIQDINRPMKYLAQQIPQHLSYFKNVKIAHISCSDFVALFLSSNQQLQQSYLDEGTLYAWGDDSEHKYGVLGLGQQYKAQRPCPNSQLFDYMIKTVSIAETHACAVDSSGRLFCWGFGPNGELGLESACSTINVPTLITKQKQINIKKAICHFTYTAFCSGAGYVYLFGTLSSQATKMHQSQSKFTLTQSASQPFNLLRSNSQIEGLKKTLANPLMQSSNRPLNLGGDTFLICLTSSGDVYFVDDSLESVQINTVSIESVAVSGSKILGIAKGDKMFEWSTAGLNKLSFNKENKMLLRQDFQIKEYQIKAEFASNARFYNLQQSKQLAAMFFDDFSNVKDKFLKNANDQDENELNLGVEDQQIVIAEISAQANKQSHFNPMNNDSSMISSQDQKDEEIVNNNNNNNDLSPSSFQNDTTPEVSITNAQDFHVPSFRTNEENQIDYCTQPSNFLSEKDISNIFNYQKPIQIQQQKPFQNQNNHLIAPTPNQFFYECDNNSNSQIPHRPSSIKSYNPTSNQSHSSYNNNSNASLKQCAADMNPLGRTSKIEISFPSFLNLSHDKGQGKGIAEQERSQSLTKQEKHQFQNDQDDKFEFSIKLYPQKSESGSREASIVREQQENEDGDIEESMTITLDSFQIKAKQTTTPKRVLSSYTLSKRSAIQITPSDQNPMDQNSQIKSQMSAHSELSNGFNITTVQEHGEERNTVFSQKQQEQQQRFSNTTQTQFQQFASQQQQRSQHLKKLNNSAGSNIVSKKRSVFMQAVLQQQQSHQKPFDIENDPTSVTQIYEASPLVIQSKEEVKNMHRAQDDQISEEDMNLMMSSSNDTYQEYNFPLQYNPPQQNHQVAQVQQREFVNQTEDNFEVDYSLSNSCTPKSNQSIIRRINFDDTTYENAAATIKVTEGDTNSQQQYVSSFRISMSQNQSSQIHYEQMPVQKISNPSQFQNHVDASQSSILFNQCQSPLQIQAEGDPMRYIQSSSTPNNFGSATQIMTLTEEKFKNLGAEISQGENQNQFLLTQNTLLSSPLLNDFNLNKADSRSLLYGTQFMNTSNIQNLSSFIKNNKYLQVYENFRRGFQVLCKMNHKNKMFSFRKIRRVTSDQKQKSEFVQGLAKFLFNTLKTHITNQKQAGFKRIKKFYKERQLQVYINQKQNEFALKTKSISRIADLVSKHNSAEVQQSYAMIKVYYLQAKQQQRDKAKKGLTQLFNAISRKNKQILEKCIRNIQNWINQKRIIEMNLNMLNRVIMKISLKRNKNNFNHFKQGVTLICSRKNAISQLISNIKLKSFLQFKTQTQAVFNQSKGISKIMEIFTSISNKMKLVRALNHFKINANKIQKVQTLASLFSEYHIKAQLKHNFEALRKNVTLSLKQDKYAQIQKTILLLMFNKVGEMIKQSLRNGFKEISQFNIQREDTFLVNKSQTTSSMSFALNMLSDNPSLILTRKEPMNATYFSQGNYQQSKSLGKSCSQGITKKNYQTNQTQDKIKKPTLNDYLSFSPQNVLEKPQNKFFNRRKTETSNTKKSGQKKTERSYLDCPLPLQCHQERMQKRAKQSENKESNSSGQLNVSIRDLNKAFKDQISRIKEKQEDSDSMSFTSQDYVTYANQQQQIESSETPEDFIKVENINIDHLQDANKIGGTKSPTLNPLCTSESYYGFQGYIGQQTICTDDARLSHIIQKDYEIQQPYSQESSKSQIENQEAENVQYSNEDKFKVIQKTDIPVTFRGQHISSSSKKKGDSRYQRVSEMDHDFSMDFEQSHNMFDEFDPCEFKDKQMKQRLPSETNIDISQIKSCMTLDQRKLNFNEEYYHDDHEDIEQLSEILNQDLKQPTLMGNFASISSPKFDQSFIPPFSMEAFNEMAANYKMMELTPETDLQMLLNNKSAFNKEESIYSQNQYADPLELALSPRQTLFSTVQTQGNYYGTSIPRDTQQDHSYIVEQGTDSKPYDFELSSHSKFKIISENQDAQNVLTSQTAQPSLILQSQGICKKLTFGYEMNKKNQALKEQQQKQKNTLYMSNGEQSINFNLTLEDEEDDEMDVGEEIPTEKRSRANLALPRSRINQQEQQEEKNVMLLSHSDLRSIAQNRMQKLNSQQMLRQSRDASQPNTHPQDFITQNIDRLRNVVKLSPRYDTQQCGSDQYTSVNSSTRNISTRSFGFFNTHQQQQTSFESQPNYVQQSNNQSKVMYNHKPQSFNTSNIQPFANRNQSKENTQIYQQPPINVRDSCNFFMQQKNSLPGGNSQVYQPLTQRGHSSSTNQWDRKGLIDRRVSCEQQQQQEAYRSQQEMKGSFSQRNLNPAVVTAQGNTKSRNKNEKLSTFLTMGAKMMTHQSDSTRQSYNASSYNMRHFQ